MKHTKWAALGLLAAIFVVCAIWAALQSNAVLAIDSVHWNGNPLPPCFLDPGGCGGHFLGTDENGRDLLTRTLAGTARAMELLATNVGMALAIGLFAGVAVSGRAKQWAAPIANGFIAFPLWMIAVIFAAATTPQDSNQTSWLTLAVVYGCFMWPLVARAVLQNRSVLEAAFAVAVPIVLADAVVNFLGYGLQPPQPTLGNMIANGYSNMETAAWAMIAPAAMLALLVFLCRLVAMPVVRTREG